ncbi:putative bifunctional diguanylate cyclase/phosphodiesterase [Oceanibaculum indicum]|uniref:Diguanylate cyclase (GGDEF)-like protein n=1 Tax=Oceanibaculum indicum TaxID=526216 RepID=A0A420WBD6_9PROT|nr:EAL domain-containing protein [Oceanibaculum indicum]RKQ68242.1 diguanylate cyclase (GGDEF)-like protein [Oceanibaculum indicum]
MTEFILSFPQGAMLNGSHDAALVALSVLVAALASYTTLTLSQRIVASAKGGLWLGVGALSMGTGIWSMHFIGMLAFDLPIPLGYDLRLTLLSLVIATALSGFALMQIRSPELPMRRLLTAGVLMGLAIAAMHYVGMAAMLMAPGIFYQPVYFALSVVIAIAAATAALFIAFHLSRHPHGPLLLYRLVAAGIMGLAIASMHYTGMLAANFPFGSICLAAGDDAQPWLVWTVAITSIVVLGGTLIAALFDSRYEVTTNTLNESLQQANEELMQLALTDQLTGLANRFVLVERLERILGRCAQIGERCAVLFIDMDNFRLINASLSHAAGDEILRQLAAILQQNFPDAGVIARFSGDKFVVVIENPGENALLIQHIDQFRKRLWQPLVLREREVAITVSIGITVFPAAEGDAKALIGQAEKAMYEAKAEGSNRFRFFEKAMHEAANREFDLLHDLRHAFAEGGLELFLQPKVCARVGAIRSVEALIRWNHPTRGLLLPGEFLGIAERFGLLGELESWTLTEACRILSIWRASGSLQRNLSLAVNISPLQFRDPGFVDRVLRIVRDYDVGPGKLILEITEHSAMHDPLAAAAAMRRLTEAGISFSIDDFGTGHSSLVQLKRLPFAELKIDRSFITDIAHNGEDRQIVEAIVLIARQFGLRVVAEGVEDKETATLLADLGIDLLQGFGIAKPMPCSQFEAMALAA